MDCTACNAALMWLGLEMREGCPGVSADLCAENGAAAGRRRERSLRMVPGETITDREVRDSVARILSSSTFALSDRHRRFLAFVVDETLAGRGNRIKAYTIATSAFGRGSDFDPQQDSIVRIEAGRLRRALEYYYLTEGSADPLRILIPKGSYVPQFARPEAPPDPGHAPGVRTTPRGPRVFVHPFEQDSGEDVFPGFGAAFTRQVVMGLTRFGTLLVYGPVATRDHPGRPARTPVSGGIDTEFVLSGTVGIAGDVVTIDLLLQEAPDGRYVWTERFERDLAASEMRALRDEVASAIVGTLGQPYGVLFSRALDHDGDAPQWLGSYRAVLDYYRTIRPMPRGSPVFRASTRIWRGSHRTGPRVCGIRSTGRPPWHGMRSRLHRTRAAPTMLLRLPFGSIKRSTKASRPSVPRSHSTPTTPRSWRITASGSPSG